MTAAQYHHANGVDAKASTVRSLNDALRRDFSQGIVVATPGVAALSENERARLLELVRAFDAFNEGNDPWGEHDFGSIELEGKTYFWKIDAFDLWMHAHSPDAVDPAVTRRVLTIMCADEY